MSLTLKLVISSILVTFIIITGIWIASLGRPINQGALTVHKLIALGFVVFTTITVIGLLKETRINPAIIVVIAIAVISIITLFATGALLSAGKTASKILLTIHAFTPVVAIISAVLAVYFLLKGLNGSTK